ncbi:MAG: hypothetical protein ACK2T7_07735 [Anaerolineales bacterium]
MKKPAVWEVIATWALTIYANLTFLVLWIGFIAALIVDRAWLDSAWEWLQALPPVPRIIVWLALLPGTVGLWIWESAWAPIWRVLGLVGIIVWTLVALSNIPKALRMKIEKEAQGEG